MASRAEELEDAPGEDAPPEPPVKERSAFWRRRNLPDETGVVVALVTLVVVVGLSRPAFLNPGNLLDLVTSTAFFGILALGTVFLLGMGEIDLSVGWMFNFSAVLAATAMKAGLDPWLGALLGIALGAGMGLINGLLARAFNVGLIIVTLGTASAYQGLSLVVDRQQPVIPPQRDTSSYFTVMQFEFLDFLPLVAVLFVLLAVVLHLVFRRSVFGFRVRAVGSNLEAADYAGISVMRTRLEATALNGALCGLSGVLFLGVRESIDPLTGSTFLLTVIAAAIIGGTPLTGGSGTVIGALIGAMIISVISSAIIFFGIQANWSTFVTGAVILGAVGVDQLVRKQRRRTQVARAATAQHADVDAGHGGSGPAPRPGGGGANR